ncbi:MAG: hypothetical protein ABIR96_11765 [Bdellovibrionota bacterium]
MRTISKLFAVLIFSSLTAPFAHAESAVDGFVSSSKSPVLVDPSFAGVGTDQDISTGPFYGIALYEFNKKIASYQPEGKTEDEIQDSQELHKKRLEEMLKKAKLANVDPNAKMKSYLLVLGSSIQIVEVKKDDPSALKKKVSELETELHRMEYQSSDEYKERAAARREFAPSGHGK